MKLIVLLLLLALSACSTLPKEQTPYLTIMDNPVPLEVYEPEVPTGVSIKKSFGGFYALLLLALSSAIITTISTKRD